MPAPRSVAVAREEASARTEHRTAPMPPRHYARRVGPQFVARRAGVASIFARNIAGVAHRLSTASGHPVVARTVAASFTSTHTQYGAARLDAL
jgi:hypothetical protein